MLALASLPYNFCNFVSLTHYQNNEPGTVSLGLLKVHIVTYNEQFEL